MRAPPARAWGMPARSATRRQRGAAPRPRCAPRPANRGCCPRGSCAAGRAARPPLRSTPPGVRGRSSSTQCLPPSPGAPQTRQMRSPPTGARCRLPPQRRTSCGARRRRGGRWSLLSLQGPLLVRTRRPGHHEALGGLPPAGGETPSEGGCGAQLNGELPTPGCTLPPLLLGLAPAGVSAPAGLRGLWRLTGLSSGSVALPPPASLLPMVMG